MLDVANKYKDELEKLFINCWYDERYKYYFSSNYRDKFKVEDNNWNEHQFVSIDKNNKILGVIGYHIDRAGDLVDSLWIINFSDNKMLFGQDVGEVLNNIFVKFNFRKLTFTVIVGNPIEKSYDKLIHKYGGRIVGTYKENVKLMDNKYYNEKLYEIFREDYLKHKKM